MKKLFFFISSSVLVATLFISLSVFNSSVKKSDHHFQLVSSKTSRSRSRRALFTRDDWYNKLKYPKFWAKARDYLKEPQYRSSNANGIFNFKIQFLPGYSMKISSLFAERSAIFKKLTSRSKARIQSLVNKGVTYEIFRKAIETHRDNLRLNHLWKAIQPLLKHYSNIIPKVITFDNHNYNIDQLLAQKTYPGKGSTLPTDAKSQLLKLVNARMSRRSQMQTALTNVNNKLLDDKWKTLKTALSTYSGFKFDSVVINKKTYALDTLWAKLPTSHYGSTLPTDAKSQLQSLVNNQITWDQIKTELDKLNNQKLDDLWTVWKNVFKDLSSSPLKVIIHNDKTYSVNRLFTNIIFNVQGHRLPTVAKQQLQQLVNKNLNEKNLKKIRTDFINENNQKLDLLWPKIRSVLFSYLDWRSSQILIENRFYDVNALFDWIAKVQRGEERSRSGRHLPDKSKIQLRNLVLDNITRQQLENAVRFQALSSLWKIIQDELIAYSGIIFTDKLKVLQTGTNISRGDFIINHLLNEKNSQFGDLSTNAKTQLQTLLDARIADHELANAFVARENEIFNRKWNNFKSNLQNYSGFKFDSVKINSKTYTLTDLWIQLFKRAVNTSLFGSDAKNQLQKLINDNVSISSVRNTLNILNNQKLDTLWIALRKDENLGNYNGYIPPQPINIDDAQYSLNLLLINKETTDAGSILGVSIKKQLQALVNGGVTDAKIVRTALDQFNVLNNRKLNILWFVVQPFLINYRNLVPTWITFNSRSYNISKLFAQKNHDRNRGFTISDSGDPSARSQLQALVNAGMTTATQMQAVLIEIINEIIKSYWSDFQLKSQNYAGYQFDTITIANKSYIISALWTKNNNFSFSALTQLQVLVENGITWEQIKTELDKLNNQKLDTLWSDLKRSLTDYDGSNPGNLDIIVDNRLYKLNLLVTNKESPTPGHALDPATKVQLQALVNGGVTNANNVKIALNQFNASNNQKLNALWSSIQPNLNTYIDFSYSSITIGSSKDANNYNIDQLFVQKDHHGLGSTLPEDAKTQLQKLVNKNITWKQIKTQLDFLKNHKIPINVDDETLDREWIIFKNWFYDYQNLDANQFQKNKIFRFNKVKINGKIYTLTNLWLKLDENAEQGSTFQGDARTQLRILVRDSIRPDSVETALKKMFMEKINIFWSKLKLFLQIYRNQDGFQFSSINISAKKYSLTALWNKVSTTDDGFAFTGDAKTQLQTLVASPAVTVEKVINLLKTWNNLMRLNWLDYQKMLNAVYVYKPNKIVIDLVSFDISHLFQEKDKTFSDLSASAKLQISKFFLAGFTDQIAPIKKAIYAYNDQLASFWYELRNKLLAYSGNTFNEVLKIQSATTGENRGDFVINYLLQEKNIYLLKGLSENAKQQINSLFIADVTDTELETTLTRHHDHNLDQKWNTLKDNFQNYAGFKSPSVSIKGRNYPLTDLWTKSTDASHPAGSTFIGTARTQLQALLNGNIDWNQIESVLEEHNVEFLTFYWNILRTDKILGGYTGYIPHLPIKIGSFSYSLNHLLDEKTNQFSALSSKAKDQLQILVNAGNVVTSKIRTALDQFHATHQKIDDEWTKHRNKLNEYRGYKFASFLCHLDNGCQIQQTIHLDALWPKLKTSENGSQFKGTAKAQLQALIKSGFHSDYWNIALDWKGRPRLWKTIRPHLSSYPGSLPSSIIIGAGDDAKTYQIDRLIYYRHNRYVDFNDDIWHYNSFGKQLQALVKDGITDWATIQTALDTANNPKLDTE